MKDLLPVFKAVLDEDKSPVVICSPSHNIIYMNSSAVKKYNGNFVGSSIFDCHNNASKEKIIRVVDWFKSDIRNNRIFTYRNNEQNKDVYMVALRDESNELIAYYEKHELRNCETGSLYDFTQNNMKG